MSRVATVLSFRQLQESDDEGAEGPACLRVGPMAPVSSCPGACLPYYGFAGHPQHQRNVRPFCLDRGGPAPAQVTQEQQEQQPAPSGKGAGKDGGPFAHLDDFCRSVPPRAFMHRALLLESVCACAQ